jgi:hypothetical protein
MVYPKGIFSSEDFMKKLAGMAALLVLNSISYATANSPKLVLDTVLFQVSAKQWINTQTALLSVNINATLTNADLVKTRADIMEKLSKIASGEWHLIQFDRSQDSSGLEKLYVQAQARVSQGSLTNVYQNAKSVSKPGAVYTIGSVEFKPSLDEVQQVRAQLRERLYQQARDELARINKIYSGQNYTLNNLVFNEGEVNPLPQYKASQAMVNTMAMPASAPNLTVSNELTLTAMVQAASNRVSGN